MSTRESILRGGVKRDVELCFRLRTDRHRQELRVSVMLNGLKYLFLVERISLGFR
jgi:hypothetical protein